MKSSETIATSRADERFLVWPQVHRLVPLSRSTIWRKIRNRSFPAPIKISEGRVAWLERDVEAWITAHLSARS